MMSSKNSKLFAADELSEHGRTGADWVTKVATWESTCRRHFPAFGDESAGSKQDVGVTKQGGDNQSSAYSENIKRTLDLAQDMGLVFLSVQSACLGLKKVWYEEASSKDQSLVPPEHWSEIESWAADQNEWTGISGFLRRASEMVISPPDGEAALENCRDLRETESMLLQKMNDLILERQSKVLDFIPKYRSVRATAVSYKNKKKPTEAPTDKTDKERASSSDSASEEADKVSVSVHYSV